MARISARDKIDHYLADQDDQFKRYFDVLPEALDEVSTAIPALAYCFHLIESGQRMGLYALIVREYLTDTKMTMGAVDRIDITRANFPALFEKISGRKLKKEARKIIAPAEKIRDAIMHGRKKGEADIQNAILDCLQYARFLNDEFFEKARFKPFGSLQGVTSKRGATRLSSRVSRLVLDGLLQRIDSKR